jgi:hypothetical protein
MLSSRRMPTSFWGYALAGPRPVHFLFVALEVAGALDLMWETPAC